MNSNLDPNFREVTISPTRNPDQISTDSNDTSTSDTTHSPKLARPTTPSLEQAPTPHNSPEPGLNEVFISSPEATLTLGLERPTTPSLEQAPTPHNSPEQGLNESTQPITPAHSPTSVPKIVISPTTPPKDELTGDSET